MVGSGNQRYRSLDGLRGVAASTVVIHHAALVVPVISTLYIEHANPSPFSAAWWLFRTPLRILMPGHEAVLVFFVLSGFVLTLPITINKMSGRKILAYYGRRLLRLYLPVWAAIGVALSLALVIQRDGQSGSSWLATHEQPTASGVLHDIKLIFGTTNLDSPLWSLTWEVWFSLLLPVIFVIVRFMRLDRWWILGIVLLSAVSASARFPVLHDLPRPFLAIGLLQYMPVFVIGMLFAMKRDELARLGHKLKHWGLTGTLAILLMLSPTMFISNSPTYRPGDALLGVACLVGVALVVFATLEAPGVRAALESKIPQWLGSRSFSLYLVHEPIIVSAALMTGANDWMPWLLVAAATVPIVLFTTEAFYRVIEHPAHLLARRTGNAISGDHGSARPGAAPEPAAASAAQSDK